MIFSPKTTHLDYLISQISTISTIVEPDITEDIQFELSYMNITSYEDITSDTINRFTRFVLDFSTDWEIRTHLQKLA